jgi:SM-20-related protein
VAGEETDASQEAQVEGKGQEIRQVDAGSQEPSAANPGRTPRRKITAPGLIDQLAERGFGVVDDFVDAPLLTQLRWRCSELQASGALRPAKVGRGAHEKLVPEVRGDFISWLQQPQRDAEQQLLGKLDELRIELNRTLMTGLEDYQGHFAIYPRGASYARHFDKLQGSDLRAISAALYLNDAWTPDDGGQLRMYLGGGRSEDVVPVGGRLVAFLSDRFEHEVLPARRERMSFTGWFRRRSLDGFV